MPRLRLPIDWLVFTAIMGTIWGGCFVAGGLYVWIGAAQAGNPKAFDEVARGVWIAGGSLLAVAPALWALGALGLIEWIRIEGGCNDAVFSRYAFVEGDHSPTALSRATSAAAAGLSRLLDRLPRPVAVVLILAVASPLGAEAIFRILDLNPLGTVMIFGAEEGRVELVLVAAGAVFLLWVLFDALARVGRLQRR